MNNYTVEDGLASNECYDIIQDKEGFIWIGSSRGLARFNGDKFTIYTSKNRLPSNLITRLYLGFDSTLWAYSHNRDFSAYQHSVDTFAPLNWSQLKEELTNFKSFAHIGKNELLMGRSSCSGYSILHLANDSIVEEIKDSGAINIKSFGSLNVFGLRSIECSKPFLKDGSTQIKLSISEDIVVKDVIKTDENTYFILSASGTIYKITNDTTISTKLDKKTVDLLFFDSDKNLWITCLNKNGVFRFENADLSRPPQHFLNGYSISSFYEDRDHGLWFSSLESGIFHAVNKNYLIYTTDDGLPEKKITESELIGDQLWLSFRNGSLGKLHLASDYGKFELVSKYEHIYDLSKDEFGLFVSAYTNKTQDNNFQLLPLSSCILPLKNQSLIRCYTAGGYSFTIKGEKVLKIRGFPRINHLVQLSASKFLAGTDEGLYQLHIDEKLAKAQHYKLLEGQISALAITDDTILAGLAHDGLIYFPKDSISKRKYLKGYNSNFINCIVADSSDRIWVGTASGIDILAYNRNKELFITKHLNTKTGLPSSVVNDIEFYKNRAYVMTDNGMAILPLSHSAPKVGPKLFFVDLKVNGLSKSPPTEVLKLRHDENNLQLAFDKIDLNYTHPFYYQYRLGKHEEWSTTQNKTIEFSKLEPGNYLFQLSSNSYSQMLELPIQIAMPWWKEWYMITAYLMVALLILYGFIRSQLAKINRQSIVAQQMNTLRFRALRAQMNPHFIYNALNAAQSFVLTESKEKAIDYLNNLSRLIRLIFENSSKDFVSIESEINSINLYVEVEKKRYPNTFDFRIEMEKLQSTIKIPPMMMQPFIENSILHGVLPKSTHGSISLTLSLKENHINVVIEDDGIGIEAAKEIGKKKRSVLGNSPQKERESAIQVTTKRIETLAKQHHIDAKISIIDQSKLNQSKTGTYVSFNLPFETTKQ